MAESDALKHLFGKELLKRMAEALSEVHPSFDRKKFQSILPELEKMEMKPRVQRIREELKTLLPSSYEKALGVLLKSLKKGRVTRFDLWPYSDFIQTYGLDDLEVSLDAMSVLTTLFTSEFSVRPFLKRHPEKTLRYLEKCAKSPDVALRRWASEGSRPRLPWGERLTEFVKDPSPTFKILETLRFDPELYVRKSVSNHLNDIAKDHPGIVIRILARWKKEAKEKDQPKIDWIIRHSLRTLIKAGHAEALNLIGVSRDAKVQVSPLRLNRDRFKLGEKIDFEFKIRSLANREQKMVVDYIIHYMKSNSSTSPKVFKLKTFLLPAGEEVEIKKSHTLKKVTTRVHYSGVHYLEIQINGVVVKKAKWDLID